jgi:hypothetical protein
MRLLLFLALLAPPTVNAQKIDADIQCKFTGTDYVYDCVIRLVRDGKPLSGVPLTVAADMPSMPMAHNIKPVKAKPGKQPGEYRARLDLEMKGEWALKLRLSGAVRDQIVTKIRFD